MVGRRDDVQIAAVRRAREVAGVLDPLDGVIEDEDAVVVAVWTLLVAALRLHAGDRIRV
jgi:hypothetical protein